MDVEGFSVIVMTGKKIPLYLCISGLVGDILKRDRAL